VSAAPTVAVIGGGITGLAAAHRATQLGAQVTLFEASPRFGGKIATAMFAGRSVDEGADAFLARVPWAVDLCRELGLDDEMVTPAPAGAYVYSRGRLRRIPEGLMLGVPADLLPLARSGLLSPVAMARAAVEPVAFRRPMRTNPDSVGDVIAHRFGRQVVDRIVDPLLGGIYAGLASSLSLAAGAPQLAGFEGRSMLLGLRRQQRALRATQGAAAGRPAPPVFYGLRNGMATLVDALTASLSADGCELHPSTAVQELHREHRGWRVTTGAGEFRADRVIVAAPVRQVPGLLGALSPEAAAALARIETASVVLVTMGLDESAVGRPLDATGFLVPRSERRFVTACSWGSTKWAQWKPDGRAVLRVSAGAIDQPDVCSLDDRDILSRMHDDLQRLMGLGAEADDFRVSRWEDAFPQYTPGHLDRVISIESVLARDCPGLIVTGAAMRGVGVPACIRQGREAAERVCQP
jgi:protoporphyrinogen/coproporphyrinogen III oxidase